MANYPLTTLITLLMCLMLLAVGINVGRARGQYGVKAPAVTGHEMFERAYRIQMNTLENFILMLPPLWVCAALMSDRVAAALGVVWLLARIWYATAYTQDPSKRGPAFGLGMTAFALVWFTAMWGVVRVLVL